MTDKKKTDKENTNHKQDVNDTLQSIVDKGKNLLAHCKTLQEKEEIQRVIEEAKKALAKGTCKVSEVSMAGINKLQQQIEKKSAEKKQDGKEATAHKVLAQVHESLEKLVVKLSEDKNPASKAKSKPATKASSKETSEKKATKKTKKAE